MECDKLAQWNLMSIVQGLLSKCNGNIQRNNRLANVNMDFFDGIVNKSENCEKDRERKGNVYLCHFSISRHSSLPSTFLLTNFSIFFTICWCGMMSPTSSLRYFLSLSRSANRILQKKGNSIKNQPKENKTIRIAVIVFFIQIFFMFVIVLINWTDFFLVLFTLINSTLLNFFFFLYRHILFPVNGWNPNKEPLNSVYKLRNLEEKNVFPHTYAHAWMDDFFLYQIVDGQWMKIVEGIVKCAKMLWPDFDCTSNNGTNHKKRWGKTRKKRELNVNP